MRCTSAAQLQALLSELQERVEHPLPQMRPLIVELNSPLPTQNRTKTHGLLSKVSFDIDHELYDDLQHGLPENIVLRGILWAEEIVITEPESKRKRGAGKKPEKGPYGNFWRSLYRSGFHNHPDIREIITPGNAGAVDSRAAWALLQKHWNEKSMSLVSPKQLRAWLVTFGVLPGNAHLVQMLQRAEGFGGQEVSQEEGVQEYLEEAIF